MSKPKTRWTREFKLKALCRMNDAGDVTALAAELGVDRWLLYKWRRKYLAGGPDALQQIGRPLRSGWLGTAASPSVPAPGASTPGDSTPSVEQRRIAELERKIGQQQLDLDFFRAALRQVRETRRANGVPGETPSSR